MLFKNQLARKKLLFLNNFQYNIHLMTILILLVISKKLLSRLYKKQRSYWSKDASIRERVYQGIEEKWTF